MNNLCIVTDNTAQFPQPSFAGRELVRVINLSIEVNDQVIKKPDELKPASFPPFITKNFHTRLSSPSPDFLTGLFNELTSSYRDVLCIFLSSELSSLYANAQIAMHSQRSNAIHIIDSHTTSIGLGILVQAAAEAETRGLSILDIDQYLRSIIPRIYSVISIPGLSYLHQNGFVDSSQAFISEMLGLYSIFSLEEGRLSSIQKVRNPRHVLDYFIEFLDEFDNLQTIALLQSSPANSQDAHLIREHLSQCAPHTPFTTHPINLPLAALFGPKTLGVFVLEEEINRKL